jgi:APA family basic amino acid/polyamine antiporter
MTPERSLRRELGLLDAVGIGFGAIIGAGIFVITGIAAGVAGPAFLVGLLVAGIAATANALSSAQLAAEFPQSGGTYTYSYQLLGPWVGFAAGWLFLASKVAAAGTVALGLAGYVQPLVPALHPRAMAVGAIAVFTALNYVGIRRSSLANLLLVAVSLGTLLLFTVVAAGSFDRENLRPFAPNGWAATLRSAALLFFAYTGYARIATLGEEVREPRITIPRAVLITIGGAILLYVAVASAAVGVVGAPALAETSAPLRMAAHATGRPWLATVVSVGGISAMLGVILSQVLGLSRVVFAMARQGDLPVALGAVHSRHATPHRAVLVVGAVAAVVAATAQLGAVAASASFTILIYYLITNFAALRLRREARLYPDAIPVIGLISCALLALSLSMTTMAAGMAILAVGIVFRWVYRRRSA